MTYYQRLRARQFLTAALGVFVAALFLLPTIWMLASAFRPSDEIFSYLSPLSWHALVPKHFTLKNFRAIIDAGFGRAVLNSLLVAGVTTIVGLVLSIMAAYALAVLRFPCRQVIFAALVVSFSLPFDSIAIPLASQFHDWGLENSYAALILPGLGNGFALFLLRQFFASIPRELREAARVDGASDHKILWTIYVPLARPPIIAAAILLFNFQWQAYLWPLLIATDPHHELGPIFLAGLEDLRGIDYGQLFAGAVILGVIPTIVMLRFQRSFTQSISTTGSAN